MGEQANKNLQAHPRVPVANDFVPNIQQKGVDLRIGLDIARLALREMVNIIVVVTGDSDLVPAFKFARREGHGSISTIWDMACAGT
ncbi:MAG: NYN domain-containing protein [Rhizomicrobium sp.]